MTVLIITMIFISESNDQSWCNIIHGCFFPLLSRVLRATLFKYPLSLRFSYICIYSFIYLFFNTVYRVYIFFGMYIWNFISLKGKWKFWFFSYYCYHFPLLMVFFYYYFEFYYDFRGLEFFFLYCIGKVSLCIINFTVHSMFGKFEKS